jgi:8-oxo-dGTP pyrophosphatase MutT (NUDIX family)
MADGYEAAPGHACDDDADLAVSGGWHRAGVSELVERVDEHDRVLGVVERDEAVRRGWPHRIAATICRDGNGAGRILLLRRAGTMPRYPGYYDVLVGGAVGVGESYGAAAARELTEELGVDARQPLRPLFTFLCTEGIGPVWFGVHEAVVPQTLTLDPDPDEIAWHGWVTEAEAREAATQQLFVPAGRRALLQYLNPEASA